MRLWHYKLVPVLPRNQLIGQWRECCLITRNIAIKGTPNHLLVNPIMDYPIDEFLGYCQLVANVMNTRGYFVDFMKKIYEPLCGETLFFNLKNPEACSFFEDWHNAQYFWQCYSNLQEKYDRGGISEEEWKPISHIATKVALPNQFPIIE